VLLVTISAYTPVKADFNLDQYNPTSNTEKTAKIEPQAVESTPKWWPWANTADPAQPPPLKPYDVPTLNGDKVDYHAPPAGLVKAPAIDADAVFLRVMGCYPEKSKYDIDVSLRASLRTSPALDLTDNSTSLGKSYVGIVASMPLYSGRELDREKDREYSRRKDTARAVADFITAIAARNQAVREFTLYRSLEARSAVRVQQGIVEASEQVGYLEKVATAQKELIQAEARIMESRLLLAGMCDPQNGATLGDWLKHLATVPTRDSAAL
jgi:hypothetical protein